VVTVTAGSTAALESPVTADDDFVLDVRVVVAFASPGRGDCPTDDGCGNTCATNASSCTSSFDIPGLTG
jgi:FxLD family lantipeptide